MTRTDFIREFEEMLSLPPGSLTPETPMNSLDAWDSVSYLSAMVLIDEKLSVRVRPELFSSAETFGEILAALETGFRN
jgi:acyl carrier protein